MEPDIVQKFKDCEVILQFFSMNKSLHHKLRMVQDILIRNNEIIEKIANSKVKDYKSLTNKTLFKFMDLIDM